MLKYQKIKETKIKTKVKDLCKKLPSEYADYLNYVRSLEYFDQPQYEELRKMFHSLFKKCGYKLDYKYDWIIKDKEVS